MRVSDKLSGLPDLDQFFSEYAEYLQGLERYEFHLRRLIACYSRGDSPTDLRREFAFVVQKVIKTDESILADPGGRHVFAHQGLFGELFRDALVLLAFGLCLRAPRDEILAVLTRCDRGDPLLETLAEAAAPGSQEALGPPQFPAIYGGLYATLGASRQDRARLVREYLSVWYSDKMEGFTFKDTHKLRDKSVYVGYWCFEAAGIVAALGIDDRSFSEHPHYPRHLVAFYRSNGRYDASPGIPGANEGPTEHKPD